MAIIKTSKGEEILVDDEDFELVSQYKWHNSHGYAYTQMPMINRKHGKNISMHRLIMNTPKNMFTDHINGNTFDNRKENLRICTPKENSRNLRAYKEDEHGFKGIHNAGKARKLKKPWYARIYIDNKQRSLGYFETAEEAAKAYDRAAIEHYGEFAKLNFENK